MSTLLPIISIGVHHRPDVMVGPDFLVGSWTFPEKAWSIDRAIHPWSNRFGVQSRFTEDRPERHEEERNTNLIISSFRGPTRCKAFQGFRDPVAGTRPAACQPSLQTMALVISNTTRAKHKLKICQRAGGDECVLRPFALGPAVRRQVHRKRASFCREALSLPFSHVEMWKCARFLRSSGWLRFAADVVLTTPAGRRDFPLLPSPLSKAVKQRRSSFIEKLYLISEPIINLSKPAVEAGSCIAARSCAARSAARTRGLDEQSIRRRRDGRSNVQSAARRVCMSLASSVGEELAAQELVNNGTKEIGGVPAYRHCMVIALIVVPQRFSNSLRRDGVPCTIYRPAGISINLLEQMSKCRPDGCSRDLSAMWTQSTSKPQVLATPQPPAFK
ncbi:hypothetical protein KCU95_g100, partial [Aureobasidium melanogenum]